MPVRQLVPVVAISRADRGRGGCCHCPHEDRFITWTRGSNGGCKVAVGCQSCWLGNGRQPVDSRSTVDRGRQGRQVDSGRQSTASRQSTAVDSGRQRTHVLAVNPGVDRSTVVDRRSTVERSTVRSTGSTVQSTGSTGSTGSTARAQSESLPHSHEYRRL